MNSRIKQQLKILIFRVDRWSRGRPALRVRLLAMMGRIPTLELRIRRLYAAATVTPQAGMSEEGAALEGADSADTEVAEKKVSPWEETLALRLQAQCRKREDV